MSEKLPKEESLMDYGTVDEAYNLLQNGILVETNKGLICMSLNDAISSDLNLSVDDLKDVATKLILQQNIAPKSKERVFLKTANLNFDSDGFSSECSDISSANISSNFITFTSLSNNLTATVISNAETVEESKFVTFLPIDKKVATVIETNGSSSISDSDISVKSDVKSTPVDSKDNFDIKLINVEVHKPPKRRGGWPKGRKRKPELLNLPPKAPATGYNLYLNEQRKLFKDSNLAFHEITKLVGNKWSNLSLEEKRPYLAKAEEDKRRYREELKQYRQSDAYRTYLAKKRRNRLQNNVLSESDMDATDEIDDEDNEELYCRTCDQWFHNLHNKREHLQGRQHTQSVAGDIKKELSNESPSASMTLSSMALEQLSNLRSHGKSNDSTVSGAMMDLVTHVARRENEIKSLQKRLQETSLAQNNLCQELSALKQKHVQLKNDLSKLKEQERGMEAKVSNLWQVPSWFIITDFSSGTPLPSSDYSEG